MYWSIGGFLFVLASLFGHAAWISQVEVLWLAYWYLLKSLRLWATPLRFWRYEVLQIEDYWNASE
uniref:hypothetical protein n=1 Tax=Bakuella subtropica TaxID=1295181 RepID=UPI0023F230B7|nr:hypothetical protein P4D19_mgp01 [Bakuella subtropica]WDY80859.1 hypothetical protein BKSUB_01 [Bakuella subtropica]